jgi:hypothetical protein
VQGSILGPVLYPMFISSLFEIESLFAFAGDKFVPKVGSNKKESKIRKQQSKPSESEESGLKINENKTEICLFINVILMQQQ